MNWFHIYDIFAKRYGIKTPDEFFEGYTLKQVSELLPIIEDNNYDDVALQAKLNGFKIKPKLKAVNHSPEKKKEYTESALSRFDQMKKDYEMNKGK